MTSHLPKTIKTAHNTSCVIVSYMINPITIMGIRPIPSKESSVTIAFPTLSYSFFIPAIIQAPPSKSTKNLPFSSQMSSVIAGQWRIQRISVKKRKKQDHHPPQ